MSIGLYDYDRRYRRRFWIGFIKFILFIALLLAVGLFAYQLGVERFKRRDASLRQEVDQLTEQKDELELLASRLKRAALNAEARSTALEARLAREIPRGDQARLLQLVAERLESGVSAERLAFVISQAEERSECSRSETKRFMLSTPIFRSPAGAVGFGNGQVSVTGNGKSAVDSSGNPEAWFDPAEPVRIRFAAHGGKETQVEDILPIHHAMVVDDTEYRFTLLAGKRSFIEVTADRCPYP